MKKLPCVFERDFSGHGPPELLPKWHPKVEPYLDEELYGLWKWDGSCCAVIDGNFYRRYDRKVDRETGERKPAPEGWIPCEEEPDPETYHWPGWKPVDPDDPADQYHVEAWELFLDIGEVWGGTYELVGPKIQGNPHGIPVHMLVPHNSTRATVGCLGWHGPRDAIDIYRRILPPVPFEGVVFWTIHTGSDGRTLPDEPVAKLRRRDLGLPWPLGKEE